MPRNIQEIIQKCKELLAREDLFTGALIVFVGVASFGLGRNSAVVPEPVSQAAPTEVRGVSIGVTEAVEEGGDSSSEKPHAAAGGQYVGSKNSNKYHLPWCSGAQSISEANKVWFQSKEEAEAAGYVPAANCKGI